MLKDLDYNKSSCSVPNYGSFTHSQPSSSTKQVTFSGWLLFLICSFSVGSHFGKHSLSGLITPILSSLGISTQQYGWMYSVQDFPGIFLPLLSGYLSLFLEPAIGVFLFATLVFIGQTLCVTGIVSKSFILILTGKALFGVGDGVLTVMQSIIIAKHFKSTFWDEEQRVPIGLGTAYGTMIAISRITTLSSVSVPPFIAQRESWGGYSVALWLSVCISGFSVLCSFVYMMMERRHHFISHSESIIACSFRKTAFSQAVVYIILIWMFVSSCLFGFLHFSSDIFVSEFDVSIRVAALLNAIITLCACIFSPLLGQLQDRLERPQLLLFFSCLLLWLAMTLLWWLLYSQVFQGLPIFWVLLFPCLCLSIAFAVGPVLLLSCLVSFTKSQDRGWVLGVYKAMENVGLLFTQPWLGYVRDRNGSYVSSLFIFVGYSSMSVVLSCQLLNTSQGFEQTCCIEDIH
ncbi:hypothetical protein GpartN1_g2560.t1 [Galdieria partita]|uniref:Lysosomal dipeptide transporter MFSD1 n=1 Tax=Galdieria partita TaxID=83374 RepID=A0A9C7PUM7_9RHOD|nr:hypothetical protein GpartN1_g2560.t1 [Galdieria partita]